MGFNCLKAIATLRRQFTFYHSVLKVLVLILSTSEGSKAQSTLEPPRKIIYIILFHYVHTKNTFSILAG